MAINRFWLLTKAVVLRFLMKVSMFLHGFPFPRPPCPTFTRTLPSRPSRRGYVKLLFYAPKDYDGHHPHHRQRAQRKYPIVVNFHGGGFCIGSASDDARWARTVVDTTGAIVVSVDYRLAPEHAFPAAVDDGVDALLYLQSHADELHLDVSRIALTGFSAGGNLAFTVPLRFYSLWKTASNTSSSTIDSDSDATGDSEAALLTTFHKHTNSNANPLPPVHIVAIMSWYPILDFVMARDIRRKRSIVPSKTLGPFLTSLFDNSYLPSLADRASPFASPIRADDALLAAALPDDIFLYMCEWDMLEHEGQEFVQRLEKCARCVGSEGEESIGDGHADEQEGCKKRVRSMLMARCRHGWDKSPNPFRDQGRVDVIYAAAGEELTAIFEKTSGEM